MGVTSTDRVFNFSAGPGCLPEPVLERAREALWNIHGSGVGILEHSHRGPVFGRVLEETIERVRRVGNICDDYAVFFMQGGASSQCYLVPANILPQGATADYYRTGKWAIDSVNEARFYGTAHVCFDGEPGGFRHLPVDGSEVRHSDAPEYVHFTSNNTVVGTQWHGLPSIPAGARVVVDASSDIFSKPFDVTPYDVVYAGAQKNLGPSGATLVVVKRDLLESPPRELPYMQSYKAFADAGSMPNTPPTFAIYLVGEVLRWLEEEGGTEEFQRRNERKASLVYDALDACGGFFDTHARADSRSLMNITFRTGNEDLDTLFVEEAAAEGLDAVRGHRIIGGMRVSMYNAFPVAGAEVMAQFIQDFARRHG